jgi:hypothetical protein
MIDNLAKEGEVAGCLPVKGEAILVAEAIPIKGAAVIRALSGKVLQAGEEQEQRLLLSHTVIIFHLLFIKLKRNRSFLRPNVSVVRMPSLSILNLIILHKIGLRYLPIQKILTVNQQFLVC